MILAAALENDGFHDIIIKDYDLLNSNNKIEYEFIKKTAMDIISTGCSYIGITAMCNNYMFTTSLASEIKNLNPNLHITIGGAHVSMCGKETLEQYKSIDSICIGEGEITYPKLIKRLIHNQNLHGLAGIIYRNKNNEIIENEKRPLLQDLDNSPFPAYELVDMKRYLTNKKTASIYIGSGCPYNCNFCTTSLVWERKYRTKSIDRVISEINYLHKHYDITQFDFIHDNLTYNQRYIASLSSGIKKNKLDITFELSSRIDSFTPDIAKWLSDAGCEKVFFGIESGSSKTQNEIGKKLKIEYIARAMELCNQYNIIPTNSFIIGFPSESEKELEKTIRLAFSCKIFSGGTISCNMLSILAGSNIFFKTENQILFNEKFMQSDPLFIFHKNQIDQSKKIPRIYSHYFSIPYKNSSFTAHKYIHLQQFIASMTDKYAHTIHVLINEIGISVLKIFNYFFKKIKNCNDNLEKLNINQNDIIELTTQYNLSSKHTQYVLDAYNYNSICNQISKKEIKLSKKTKSEIINIKNWHLIKSNLELTNNNNTFFESILSQTKYYYIIVNDSQSILTCKINQEEYYILGDC